MLGTSRTGTRFYCPACGVGLRAPQADAGTAIDCDGCGVGVRVPRRPHPFESEADDGPLVSAPAAAAARAGLRLLARSLRLYALGLAVSVLTVAAWAWLEGPAAVLTREPGRFGVGPVFAAGFVLGLALVAAGLRWVGYGFCRPAADAVRAGGWVAVARTGVLAAALGSALASGPALVGTTAEQTPVVLRAVAHVGEFVRLAGGVAEFAVLFVWARLLTEAGGPAGGRRVGHYAAAVVAAVGGVAASVCVAGSVIVMSLRQNGPPPPPTGSPAVKFDYGVIPTDGWLAAGGAALVVVGFAAALVLQYHRLLKSVQSAVAGPDAAR